jgi:DNA-binding MarR family transcriptional regulator
VPAIPLEELPTIGLLSRAFNELAKVVFQEMAAKGPGDTRPSHGNVLQQLEIEDGLRLTDIAERSGITPQSAGALVDELEALQYLERRTDSRDRRAKRIHLTAKGRKNARLSYEVLMGLEQELRDQLGPRRLKQLRNVLTEIIDSTTSRD